MLPSHVKFAYLAPPCSTLTHFAITTSLSLFTFTMEGKGASPATQLNRCDAYKTLTLGKPVRKTVTVSAAAIFKNRGRGGIHQGQTDLQNLQKPATKIKKIEQKEEPHPLTLDFKGFVMYLLIE